MTVRHAAESHDHEIPQLLLVDGDDAARAELAAGLMSHGFAVLAVTDGLNALREIERCRPDAVLADVRMPGMDGMMLLDALRLGERFRELPVVLMSAWKGEGMAAQAFASGATDFVTKPASAADISARVHARLRDTMRMTRLERDSLIDPLTGVCNRRGTMAALERELRRARRARRALAVVLIDVNDFKAINDSYGHDRGDEVLRALAERFTGRLRATDVVGRIGGDEFVVLLPEQDECGALTAVDRLRAAAARVRVGGAPVRISAGVACSPDGRAEARELLRIADATMYTDKRTSRFPVQLSA